MSGETAGLTAAGETERLCEFVTSTGFSSLPWGVVEHARRMVLDTVGVTVRAVDEEAVRIATETTAGVDAHRSDADARVPGTALAGDAGDVAFVTGVMSHALDFDDLNTTLGGHPSAPVLSAVLPLAEARDASGAELLRAFVHGVETVVLLGEVLNPGHYERGWHPTAVCGHVGSAVAAGALLELDTEGLRRAVGIAVSQAGGTKANFGTMTKPYHVGRAARAGVEAARLAEAGFTANESALEADFGGLLDLFEGEPAHSVGTAFETLDDRWWFINPPTGFKPYPCCGSTFAAVDAALDLYGRGVDVDDVESVTVIEHQQRLDHTNRPEPTTGLEGKFSVQYCVALALATGDVWLDDFTDEAVRNGPDLVGRVEAIADGDAIPNDRSARIVVEMADGSEHERTVEHPYGSPNDPMGDDALDDKYRRCAGDVLDEAAVDASLDAIRDVENAERVGDVLDHLAR
jgi:2-methylcitrate dehydratase PrpD